MGTKEGGTVKVELVPLSKESLTDRNAFIVDVGRKIYVWCGQFSSPFVNISASLHAEKEAKARPICEATREIDTRFWELLGGQKDHVRSDSVHERRGTAYRKEGGFAGFGLS